jgi:hypothetical protein
MHSCGASCIMHHWQTNVSLVRHPSYFHGTGIFSRSVRSTVQPNTWHFSSLVSNYPRIFIQDSHVVTRVLTPQRAKRLELLPAPYIPLSSPYLLLGSLRSTSSMAPEGSYSHFPCVVEIGFNGHSRERRPAIRISPVYGECQL